ncbi:MAG TPA: hypothetical protein VGW12_09935 [Pyrinomonadaceae bacterium]|nr:hypothetical protein [Pyrinomonadaceae bacterium]
MKQIDALCKRLLQACAMAALAVSISAAQTPAGNNQQTGAKPSAGAPGAEKSSDKRTAVEEELAKTPVGKTVSKFFAALNSGDIKTMRAFHEAAGGDVDNAEKDFGFYERTGGVKLHSLTSADKGNLVLLVQAKKDERWISFNFTVDTQEPYSISSINVRPASAPAN